MKGLYYAAYGSNMNLRQMALRCPHTIVKGTSILVNWRLCFRGFHRKAAVATIEPCDGYSVPLLIWYISDSADEQALDIYEGFPRLYRKEWIKVRLGSRNITAMVYVMNDGRPFGSPSASYYATILEGYKKANIDPAALQEATIYSAR
jgi:hypothetical protein